MNNHNDHSNFDSEVGGAMLGLVAFIVCITLAFTANFHIPNSGQHTGYVTSVEQSGIIWKTWTAYVKTDPQSSQEDSYCVTDPNVVRDLQSAATEKSSITVYYSVPLMTWKWHCGWEQSTIVSDSLTSPSPSPSTSTASPASDPTRYSGVVTQTGGIDSQTISMRALNLTPRANTAPGHCLGESSPMGYCIDWLNPAESYVSVRFFGPGPSLGGQPNWVGAQGEMVAYCKDGYVITHTSSSTNSPLDTYFMGIPNYGVGIEILNQPENTIQITCEKK